MRILDRTTLTTSVALLVAALIACKKEEAPPPVASAPPTPTPTTTASAEPPKQDKKDDVKRYGDKEQDESGTVRVKLANAKVYKEADETTDHVTTLSFGTLVNRKARYGTWMLVDYPSGVGELSPGWILTKHLEDKVLKIDAGIFDASFDVAVVPDAAAVVPEAAAPPTPDAAAPPVVDAGKKGRLNWGAVKEGMKK